MDDSGKEVMLRKIYFQMIPLKINPTHSQGGFFEVRKPGMLRETVLL